MNNKNWFWGVYLILAAALLIASQFVSFAAIGFWSIVATILLVAMIIQSLIRRHYPFVLVPAAILYVIYQKPLGLAYVSPWMLITAAVLAAIGLSLIFRKHPEHFFCSHTKGHSHGACEHYAVSEAGESQGNQDDNNPYAKVRFGSVSRYLHSTNLTAGHFAVSFGAIEVFMEEAQIDPAGAQIFLECSFGAITLYVPKHWNVVDRTNKAFGGVEIDTRIHRPAEGAAPTLVLTGNVNFGGVEVRYV
ncbi:MAG: LiaF transmembrane domain-containing protein [Christensenellales bacterium]|jgi:predicted membrane protein